jgi:hypothetical protein
VRILPGLHGRVRVQRPCYALAAFLKMLESLSSRKLSELFKSESGSYRAGAGSVWAGHPGWQQGAIVPEFSNQTGKVAARPL